MPRVRWPKGCAPRGSAGYAQAQRWVPSLSRFSLVLGLGRVFESGKALLEREHLSKEIPARVEARKQGSRLENKELRCGPSVRALHFIPRNRCRHGWPAGCPQRVRGDC